MSADALAIAVGIAEIVGVLVIIASLLFVGRQLRQNNELLRLQTAQTMLESWLGRSDLTIHNREFGDILYRSQTDPDSLDDVDVFQIMQFSTSVLKVAEVMYLQWLAGNIDDRLWHGFRANITVGFRRSGTRRLAWEDRKEQFSDEFCALVDQILEEIDEEAE